MEHRPMKSVICLVSVVFLSVQSVAESADDAGEANLAARHAGMLVDRLVNPRFEEAAAAAGALCQYGEIAVPALQKAVRDPSHAELGLRAGRLLNRITKDYPSRQRVPDLNRKILAPIVEKNGKILNSQRWTANKTYRVMGDLSIMPGGALRIDAGTVVLLPAFANIEVEERAVLEIGSTDGARAVLTTVAEADGNPGRWGWLRVRGVGKLYKVDVRHSLGVQLDSYDCDIDDMAIYDTGTADTLIGFHHKNAALRCTRVGERGELGSVTVRDARGAGVVFDGQSVHCKKLDVSGARKGVVIFKGSPSIGDVQVQYAREEGLYVGWQTSPKIRTLQLDNCTVGALWRDRTGGEIGELSAVKSGAVGLWIEDQSSPKIHDVKISGSDGHGVYVRGRSFPVIDSVKGL
jgi:hypothetical protein